MAETAVCLVDVCSYAGTGNVLKIQDMLHICSEHAGSPKKASQPNGESAETAPKAPIETTGGDVNMFEAAAEAAAPASEEAPRAGSVNTEAFDDVLRSMTGGGAAGAGAAGTTTADPLAPASNGAAAEGADAVPQEEESTAQEEGEPKPLKHQAVATLGIALIAMGEDIGSEMALRQFQHLVRPSLFQLARPHWCVS